MMTSREALQRLRAGNQRFVSGSPENYNFVDQSRRNELTEGQNPFATILSCSDSRVPPEIVFDQGLGDLFVVRVAGNIAEPTQIGSVEFAALHLGTPLVVVLGHTGCGAVLATIKHIEETVAGRTRNLEAIIEFVRPSVEPLLKEPRVDGDALVRQAVRANVAESVRHLVDSAALKPLIESGSLDVVGAEYEMETGLVHYLSDI